MRLLYRSLSSRFLREIALEALTLVRESEASGIRVGPKSVKSLLEVGLVLDGPDAKVKDLDRRLQRKLRDRKIPFVRRDVSVIRPDTGPSTFSTAVASEALERAMNDLVETKATQPTGVL